MSLDRVVCIKKIAKVLGAKYQTNLKEYTNFFNLTEIATSYEIEDSNAIVGNIEGYHYCFLELNRMTSGGIPRSNFTSKAIINIKKDNHISFSLLTRKSAILHIVNRFLMAFVFTVFYLAYIGFNRFSFNYQVSLYLVVFLCLILLIALLDTIKTIYKISFQKRYNIQNSVFNNNYVILSDSEPRIIGELFNEEVCSRIVNSKLDTDIIVKNNCIILEFDHGAELSLEGCRKYLYYLVNQAKLFK